MLGGGGARVFAIFEWLREYAISVVNALCVDGQARQDDEEVFVEACWVCFCSL